MKRKNKTFKQLKNKYWPEVRRLILERDKHTCQLCGIRGVPLDIDHVLSRSCQILHFDERNLNALCKTCHMGKSYHREDYPQRVDDICISKWGADTFKEMRFVSRQVYKITEEEVINAIQELQRKYEQKVFGKR